MIYNKTIDEKAYAKINLFLDVTARRADGFHDIRSIMQSVSLCDTVSISITENSEDILKCNIQNIPTDGKNLAIKAVNAFRREFGMNFGARIHLEKRIPDAAGLGGGSSDAAAVLRALKTLTEIDVKEEIMLEIAASIGADVPFCYIGSTMLAEGKGDLLSPQPACPRMHCVIAKKGEGVSTPEAYSMLDSRFGDFSGSRDGDRFDKLLVALKNGDAEDICRHLYNIFEAVTEPVRPEIGNLKKIMMNCGARSALMSGSGPSVFGFFKDESSAFEAVKSLSEYGAAAYYCTT